VREVVQESVLREFESVDDLAVLLDVSPVPMFAWDVQTMRIIGAGRAAAELYGWSVDELCSMTVLDIRPVDDRPTFQIHMESFIADFPALVAGPRFDTARHLSKDGEIHYVTPISRPCLVAGRPTRLTVVHDDTARVQSERARDTAIDELTGLGERVRVSVAERLHDGPVQILTAASLRVGMLRREAALRDDPRLVEIERLVILALQDVRREMDEHRAPAEMSSTMSSSLRQLLRRHSMHESIDLMVGGPEPAPGLSAAIYRMIQSVISERLIGCGTSDRPRPMIVNVTPVAIEITLPVGPQPDAADRISSWSHPLGATVAAVHTADRSQLVVVRVPHAPGRLAPVAP
jgi:PAS domain S-box-containing protein